MYCSSCGSEVKKDLNYCNSCSARVADIEKEKSGTKFRNLSKAIGFISLSGFIGFIFLVMILLENKVDEPIMVVISLAFLATIFGISYLLIKQLSENSSKSEQNIDFKTEVQTALNTADTNQLEEPRQAPASVVEKTTRTLDKVPVERN